LEEARIPIDLVGGTSIGAIIGAQYASGWDSGRMLAESRRVLLDDGPLNDYTLPLVSILRGKRYSRMLEKLFADRRIEDLPLSFFCVSTNLTRSTCLVHRTGKLLKWVSASMAVPGMGPPVFDGKDVLVDGGVVNNLPVDVMRALGRGPVFASNVASRTELCLDQEYADLPSPWRLLLNWLNPFAAPMGVPTMARILMRTVSLHQVNSGGIDSGGINPAVRQPAVADLVFDPPLENCALMDWRSFDKTVEIGYRSAVATIEAWQTQQRTPSPAH
jgi:predicted acylesterase/phospholipase RssA